jgi:hypothetical protein
MSLYVLGMKRYFQPIQKAVSSGSNLPPDESTTTEPGKKPHVCALLTLDDIVVDPGLRKPIDEYDVGIMDKVRRKYLLMGPCQPATHNFRRKQHDVCSGSFNKAWFKKFDWLEYSVEKDAAYCFYCYLFEQAGTNKFGSPAISVSGFSNWNDAFETFNGHVGGVNSSHDILQGNTMRISKVVVRSWLLVYVVQDLFCHKVFPFMNMKNGPVLEINGTLWRC